MKEDWTYKKLEEVCSLITKGTTPTSLGFDFTEQGVAFVKIESLTEDGGILPSMVAHISDDCNNALKRSQLEELDILYSIAGALGRVAIVPKSILPANTNQALAIIRLRNKEIGFIRFLKYFLTSRPMLSAIMNLTNPSSTSRRHNSRNWTTSPKPSSMICSATPSRMRRDGK